MLKHPRNWATFNRPDKVWYLRQTGLFDRLGEPELQRIAELSRMREFPRGAVILGPHSDPDLIYLVKTGRVKISTFSPQGKEQILALLERGDVFGELAPAEAPMPTHVEAFDHAIVCTLHRTLFEDILRRTPEVGVRVIRALARRLRAAEQEIEDLALRSVPGRLAALLLRLAEEYGEALDHGIRLSLRLTHQDLAHMVGSTRETVTALINRFRDEGLITVDHRILVILERDGLRQIASSGAVLHQ
jgi:CRP/FNR family transcriptional regulator